jgi:hypothetical protein
VSGRVSEEREREGERKDQDQNTRSPLSKYRSRVGNTLSTYIEEKSVDNACGSKNVLFRVVVFGEGQVFFLLNSIGLGLLLASNAG